MPTIDKTLLAAKKARRLEKKCEKCPPPPPSWSPIPRFPIVPPAGPSQTAGAGPSRIPLSPLRNPQTLSQIIAFDTAPVPFPTIMPINNGMWYTCSIRQVLAIEKFTLDPQTPTIGSRHLNSVHTPGTPFT